MSSFRKDRAALTGTVSILLLCVVAVLGCSPAKTVPEAPKETVPPSAPPPMFRLAREVFAGQRAVQHAPLALGGNSEWQKLDAHRGDAPPALYRDVSLDAKDYNVARVSMRASRGKTARLTWTGSLEPDAEKNPGASVAILADGDVHTYCFVLDPRSCETWAGNITRLHLTLADEAAEVSLESLELAFSPPDGPLRVTIDNETQEAIAADDLSWSVTIPPNGVFEASVGMLERAWKSCGTDGVAFKAVLEAPNGAGRVLVDTPFDPVRAAGDRKWRRFRVDLGGMQGVQAKIRFTVNHAEHHRGDYAFWGNPVVYTADKNRQDTPVILISCDSLRADHLSCYGYSRPTSPHLDEWARETVLFENAICQEAWTPTSHMTMLTGLYPKNHKLTSMTNLAETVPTLADVLSGLGYRAAGFTGHYSWLAPKRGFEQGFDLYSTPAIFRSISETLSLLQLWMNNESSSRLFLFVHNYDIHFRGKGEGDALHRPYEPSNPAFNVFSGEYHRKPGDGILSNDGTPMNPPATDDSVLFTDIATGGAVLSEDTRQFVMACYDDCIQYVDSDIHTFFDALKRAGIYDRALIIVTADHGEEFHEHGSYNHLQAYEECVRVPLMIKFPFGRHAGRRIHETVQLTDLFPTVMDVLGVADPPANDGQNLLGVIEGKEAARNRAFTQRRKFQAYRDGTHDIVCDRSKGKYELFDLAADPAEKTDLSATVLDVLADMKPVLTEFYKPVEEGWCLYFRGTGETWKGDLRLATGDRFLSATMVNRPRLDIQEFDMKDTTIKAYVLLTPVFKQEELIVQTAAADAKIVVFLTGDTPFEVPTADGGWERTTQARFVLDPAAVGGAEPPAETGNLEVPRFFFRHRTGAATQTPAKEFTPEEKKQMEAIGYF